MLDANTVLPFPQIRGQLVVKVAGDLAVPAERAAQVAQHLGTAETYQGMLEEQGIKAPEDLWLAKRHVGGPLALEAGQ